MESSKIVVVVLSVLCIVNLVKAARWAHSAYLSPDYRMLWSLGPGPQDITIELQVRTLGYVGFGFSKDGRMAGADMVVGWVDHGQVYFQVKILIINRIKNSKIISFYLKACLNSLSFIFLMISIGILVLYSITVI